MHVRNEAKGGQFQLEAHISGSPAQDCLQVASQAWRAGGLVRNRVHLSAFMAHRVAIAGKLRISKRYR